MATVKTAKPKSAKEVQTKKTGKPKVIAKTSAEIPVEIFDMTGKGTGTIGLPKAVFGQKYNAALVAQAVKVYQTNQRTHTAHTKTRGEVSGGGSKPWKQKGTGRARAGSSRSPIWVGGGRVFGPRFRDVKLDLPQKMKHKAMLSMLSAKVADKQLKVLAGVEHIDPKTKTISNLVKNMKLSGSTLIVVSQKNENLSLATRNFQKVEMEIASNLNALKLIIFKNILLSKESIGSIK